MALLKLHCRPNDLDCWVEALAGSQSLYRLYVAGGESVHLPEGEEVPSVENAVPSVVQSIKES